MLRIAHRGAPNLAPENSLEGFRASLAYDPDIVEMDVRISKDGHPVIIHDPTVDRTTDGAGKVAKMTLVQLRSCFLRNGEPVPTLAEAIELIKGRAVIKLDVKVRRAERLIVHELRRAGAVRGTIIIAYGKKSLLAFKALGPGLRTEVGGVYAKHRRGRAIGAAMRSGAGILSVRHAVVDAKFATKCRLKGLAIHAWTVNDPHEAARLRALGVAAVATDRLDII